MQRHGRAQVRASRERAIAKVREDLAALLGDLPEEQAPEQGHIGESGAGGHRRRRAVEGVEGAKQELVMQGSWR